MKHGLVSGLLGIVLGTALIGVGSVAWADGHKRSCHDGRSSMGTHGVHGHGVTGHLLRHLLKNKQDLGLTDEQIGKLRGIALDADKAGIRAGADVLVAGRELRSMMWDKKADLSAIEAKVKERANLEAAATMVRIKAKRELLGVLTDEQRTKLKSLWEQKRHGHGGYKQRAEAADANDAEAVAEGASEELELELADAGSSAG